MCVVLYSFNNHVSYQHIYLKCFVLKPTTLQHWQIYADLFCLFFSFLLIANLRSLYFSCMSFWTFYFIKWPVRKILMYMYVYAYFVSHVLDLWIGQINSSVLLMEVFTEVFFKMVWSLAYMYMYVFFTVFEVSFIPN